jgi:cell wall-associated NlpC family hydrolase
MSTALCPDQGESGVPLDPGVDPHQLPDGFTLPADPAQRAAVSFALDQVGKPYVFGAKGPDAFDCSGLTTAAWAAAGVGIPAGTVNQKLTGTAVTIGQIAPGDLVFIPGSLGSPTNPRHVGLYAGHGVLVSANDSRSGVVLRPLADWAGQIVTIRHVAGPTGEPSTSPALSGAG